QVLPWLTLGGTLLFTFVVPRLTAPVVLALERGPDADTTTLALGIERATTLPNQLAWVNFSVWLTCASVGTFGFRTLFGWTAADATVVVALGLLFAWGISFYQRAWHVAILQPAGLKLRSFKAKREEDTTRAGTLQGRMLIEFGLPL